MRKQFLVICIFVLFLTLQAIPQVSADRPKPVLLQVVKEQLNPREIGYLEADLTFASSIQSSIELEKVNYSVYILPEGYKNLESSADYYVADDDYGNKSNTRDAAA